MECGIPCAVEETKATVAKNGVVAALVTRETKGGPTSRRKASQLSPRESDPPNEFSSKLFRIYVCMVVSL